jgi:hypothetical protein
MSPVTRILSAVSALAALSAAALVASGVVIPAPAAASPAVTKVLVFVEENHSLSQMQSGMPYTYGLAKEYGYATNYTATRHPSLPNYLAIAGGSTFGVADDNSPSSHHINSPTVFGQARALGKTAKVYADGMQSNCALSNGGNRYVVKHNPWAYFTPSAERSGCLAADVPESKLQGDVTAGTLPNVGMVIPNMCNDAHDCSLSTADNWFKSRMTAIQAGADWKSGHLAVVLTADEDDRNSGNKVLTAVFHQSQQGNVVTSALTHYSLTRLLEDVVGASHLNNAASAPNMATAFGLPLTETTTTPPLTPAPTPAPATNSAAGGWGAPVAQDGFNYTGAPDSSRWGVYNTGSRFDHGYKDPSAMTVGGGHLTITGRSDGHTGGMSMKAGRRYGKIETQMRTGSRDPKYHPVLIWWPDGNAGTRCEEIDYAEASKDTANMHFYLHYGCGGVQTTAGKAIDTTRWHNYAMAWTPTSITGYIDGVKWFSDTNTAHVPDLSMHPTIQFDYFPVSGQAATQSQMFVNWTRVYQ